MHLSIQYSDSRWLVHLALLPAGEQVVGAWLAAGIERRLVILLEVSLKDTTGLPGPEVLPAMEGYTLLRADCNGWIELAMGGVQMWV